MSASPPATPRRNAIAPTPSADPPPPTVVASFVEESGDDDGMTEPLPPIPGAGKADRWRPCAGPVGRQRRAADVVVVIIRSRHLAPSRAIVRVVGGTRQSRSMAALRWSRRDDNDVLPTSLSSSFARAATSSTLLAGPDRPPLSYLCVTSSSFGLTSRRPRSWMSLPGTTATSGGSGTIPDTTMRGTKDQ